jgi:Ser/Thr protein kinase RdoA (MazF antagonist)
MTIPWHAFGPSLESLIRQQPARLDDAVAISPLASAESRRAAFRLQFCDGRVLKGRYLETAQQGETVWRLSNEHLHSAPVARIVAWRSEALLEEWLPGLSMAADCNGPEILRAAGALLGRLHRTAVRDPHPRRALEPRWIDESLDADRLVAAGRLDPAAACEAASMARQSAPAIAEWGFCHGDFCAENLLIVPELGLHVVDNETICELWQDYDLARTWYRWPMDTLAFGAFLDGYRLHRAADEFLAHFAFWTIAVLLRSAVFRLRNGVSPELPIQRLLALLQAPSPSPLWALR